MLENRRANIQWLVVADVLVACTGSVGVVAATPLRLLSYSVHDTSIPEQLF